LIELDLVCQRYHVLPSDLLELDVRNYQFTQLVAQAAIEKESLSAKKSRIRHGK